MGQYHKVVSMDAKQHIDAHFLGCGLKEWEQMGGPYPAALAFLLSHKPGNMPADIGHHPITGQWAGHRILAIGDYAEADDIEGFDGPPLDRLYALCQDEPILEEFGRYDNPQKALKEAKAEIRKLLRQTRSCLFPGVGQQMRGAIEYVQSVRYVGQGWMTDVPVKPYAERGSDGHLHYRIADHIAKDDREWAYVLRCAGFAEGLRPTDELGRSGERFPWDRPPADMSWHDATDADQDLGQNRVYVNLDRREFVDPAAFGEVPTTMGIMRATDGRSGWFTSSAAAVLAMLYLPESRGGGDITTDEYPEKGRWRNCHLALTAEHSSDASIPTTDEAKALFTDISHQVLNAAVHAKAMDEAA